MYYINKRIGEAQKSVAEYQKKVAEKQQYLHASDPEELLVEQKSEWEVRFVSWRAREAELCSIRLFFLTKKVW